MTPDDILFFKVSVAVVVFLYAIYVGACVAKR